MSEEGSLDPHGEKEIGKVYDLRLLLRLFRYLNPHRRLAWGAVSLIAISSVLQLVGPLITAVALDLFVHLDSASPEEAARSTSTVSRWVASMLQWQGFEPTPRQGIALASSVYLVALVLVFAVLYLQSWVMQIMGQLVMFDVRRDVFAKLQALPVPFLDRNPIGRLVTRATTDVAALNELFTAGFVSIFGDLVLLIGILGVLFLLNWKLALVSFSILPLLLALSAWFKTRARDSYRDVRVRIARLNSFFQEHVSGMSVVQLFGRESIALKEFSEINDRHRRANIGAIFYYAVYYPSVELITAFGLALIVWYGGGQIVQGTLSMGALVAFLQYAQRFYQPIADLSEKYNVVQSAMASAERIFQLLDEEAAIQSPANGYLGPLRGSVRFDQVSFGYEPGRPVIENLSFSIDKGEMVAIVGHTGAGKSTIASLLLRFYDLDHGSISIDGVDIREWDLAALRSDIAMVLQDVYLFSGSIAENIRLGRTDIDEGRIRWAAQESAALEFIEQQENGFDFRLKERGAGLSVGQKQLLAFARALALDPRILVLDEATAAIDSETEHRIQRALDKLLEGRTSIVIAHRLSTIQRADRILVLHRGELREQGSHRQLMEKGGIYRTLVELQYPD